MAIINCHSPLNEASQFGNRGPVVRGWVTVLMMFVLGLGAGCGSIYQQTRATLPPETCAQLKFRVNEAQRAETLAEQAVTKLRVQLNHGLSGEAIETDVDRLEAAAFDFERRVASAWDAAVHCWGQTQLASEIERLHGRSKNLLEYVQAVRRGGNPTNARQLDQPLNGFAKP